VVVDMGAVVEDSMGAGLLLAVVLLRRVVFRGR
jgi:hypothetical protein